MRRRQGFTLVEMLVAMALIIFIMAILSQAFVSATGTFRILKASGDMAEKLRATTQLLQRDLAADHFEGKKRLSNANFWLNGPPQQGYFQVWQLGPGTSEGADLDGINSFLSTGHTLAFTIKTRGNQMGDFLSAGGGMAALSGSFGPPESRYQGTSGGSYNYQWAEVAWFLQQSINPATGQQDTTVNDPATGSSAVPLYTLFRRQHLAVPDNSLVPQTAYTAAAAATCLELSCWNNGGNFYFNSPEDLTVPERRFGGSGLIPMGAGGNPPHFTSITQDLNTLGASNPTLAGADIQLNDVVSFDVRLLQAQPPAVVDPFLTLFDTSFTGFYSNGNPNYYNPANPNSGLPAVFDTWSSINDSLSSATYPPQGGLGGGYSTWSLPGSANPNPATSMPLWNASAQGGPNILAIQISIRIWDSKTNQTRQVTIVQAM